MEPPQGVTLWPQAMSLRPDTAAGNVWGMLLNCDVQLAYAWTIVLFLMVRTKFKIRILLAVWIRLRF